MTSAVLFITIIIASFTLVVLFGAPFVPTHAWVAKEAVALAGVKKGQRFLDMGSGNGLVLRLASECGAEAVGYELNPILVLYSRWRLRKLSNARVVWGSYRKADLCSFNAIFMFGLQKEVNRTHKLLDSTCSQTVRFVTYGFEVTGKTPAKQKHGLSLYEYRPVARETT